MAQFIVDQETLLIVLEEVKSEIRFNGICAKEKAQLFHELGSIHGLLGNSAEQRGAWEEALKLDPDNYIVKLSLKKLAI